MGACVSVPESKLHILKRCGYIDKQIHKEIQSREPFENDIELCLYMYKQYQDRKNINFSKVFSTLLTDCIKNHQHDGKIIHLLRMVGRHRLLNTISFADFYFKKNHTLAEYYRRIMGYSEPYDANRGCCHRCGSYQLIFSTTQEKIWGWDRGYDMRIEYLQTTNTWTCQQCHHVHEQIDQKSI